MKDRIKDQISTPLMEVWYASEMEKLGLDAEEVNFDMDMYAHLIKEKKLLFDYGFYATTSYDKTYTLPVFERAASASWFTTIIYKDIGDTTMFRSIIHYKPKVILHVDKLTLNGFCKYKGKSHKFMTFKQGCWIE